MITCHKTINNKTIKKERGRYLTKTMQHVSKENDKRESTIKKYILLSNHEFLTQEKRKVKIQLNGICNLINTFSIPIDIWISNILINNFINIVNRDSY